MPTRTPPGAKSGGGGGSDLPQQEAKAARLPGPQQAEAKRLLGAGFDWSTVLMLLGLAQQYGPQVVEMIRKILEQQGIRGAKGAGAAAAECPELAKIKESALETFCLCQTLEAKEAEEAGGSEEEAGAEEGAEEGEEA